MYAIYGNIDSMVENPYRNQILDNELGNGKDDGTHIQEPKNKPVVFAGERIGQQFTLNLFGDSEPVAPVAKKRRKSKK